MRNKKNIIIAVMIAVALLMATGYAYFATRLNINATGSISSTWNIYFSRIDKGTAVGNATNNGDPYIEGNLKAVMSAKLDVPGDSMTYELYLTNGGSVPAIIESIEAKAEGSSAIIFSIDGIKKGDKLAGGAEKTITIKIEYDPNVTSQPSETTKTLTININAVQDTGQKVDEENLIIEGQDNLLVRKILGKNNSNVVGTGDGLYVSTATNDGRPTYYYKGNVTNNYVSFANLTWRVIRINEDGTVKLILDDSINNDYFNQNNYDSYEYMYYSNSDVENGIKNTVDTWYTNTLETNYDSYIATTSFCEAAKVKSTDSFISGNATMELSSNYKANFKCEEDGNNKQYVNEKAGLITVDEAAMVGIPLYAGSQTNNKNTYLQKSYDWWTMSPAGFGYGLGMAYFISDFGNVSVDCVGSSDGARYGVRPVISLNSNVQVTGSGITDDMWVVQ